MAKVRNKPKAPPGFKYHGNKLHPYEKVPRRVRRRIGKGQPSSRHYRKPHVYTCMEVAAFSGTKLSRRNFLDNLKGEGNRFR